MISSSGRRSRRRSLPGRLPRVLAAALVAAAGAAPPCVHADDSAAAPRAADEAEARLRDRLAEGPKGTEAEGIRAWSNDVAAEGRLRRGTDLGGDLLAGAASALETRGIDLPRALSLVDEAIAAYPAGRAAIGFAWFERAVLKARLGDPEGALAALDAAAGCAAAAGGLDAPRDDADRRAALAAQLDGLGRSWRADLLTALGRHAEAAALHEQTAARNGGRGADGAWERAAVASYRAGDRERADRCATAAIEAARDDGRVVDLTQWRLYARHAALDARGEVRLTDAWAGDAFLAEARTTLGALEGRKDAWRLAVQVASSASAAGRMGIAVEMYELAFRDPSFEQAARASPLARQRILTAALAALRAGDPAKARAWLELAVQYAGEPIAGTEGLSLAIDEALTRAQTARLAGGAPAETPSPPRQNGGRRGGGAVVPAAPDADDAPMPDDEGRAAAARPAGRGPPWRAVACAVALAALGSAAWALVARRRRRPTLGPVRRVGEPCAPQAPRPPP